MGPHVPSSPAFPHLELGLGLRVVGILVRMHLQQGKRRGGHRRARKLAHMPSASCHTNWHYSSTLFYSYTDHSQQLHCSTPTAQGMQVPRTVLLLPLPAAWLRPPQTSLQQPRTGQVASPHPAGSLRMPQTMCNRSLQQRHCRLNGSASSCLAPYLARPDKVCFLDLQGPYKV